MSLYILSTVVNTVHVCTCLSIHVHMCFYVFTFMQLYSFVLGLKILGEWNICILRYFMFFSSLLFHCCCYFFYISGTSLSHSILFLLFAFLFHSVRSKVASINTIILTTISYIIVTTVQSFVYIGNLSCMKILI